jgi:pimeloyl-ACP methyl ester carboxylesterase
MSERSRVRFRLLLPSRPTCAQEVEAHARRDVVGQAFGFSTPFMSVRRMRSPRLWKAVRVGLLTVNSGDGTRIAAHVSGSGPSLLLVHGATADHSTTWQRVLSKFEQRFTVYRMDRRGRGNSGDEHDYAIEREFEDVAALVDAIGGPVLVVGHSYGAEVALGALLLTTNIKSFVHYEGGIPAVYPTPAQTIDDIQRLIDEGDRDTALAILYRDILGMDPDEFRAASGEAAWAARLRNVHTLPRELRAENDFDISRIENRLRRIEVPVLLLLGGESPRELVEPSERLAALLPNCRVEGIDGEAHAAMFGSPAAFVEIVTRFFDETTS